MEYIRPKLCTPGTLNILTEGKKHCFRNTNNFR